MVGPKWHGDTFLAAHCCGTFDDTFCDTLLGPTWLGENGAGPKLVGKLAGYLELVGGVGLDAGGSGACLADAKRPGGGPNGMGSKPSRGG